MKKITVNSYIKRKSAGKLLLDINFEENFYKVLFHYNGPFISVADLNTESIKILRCSLQREVQPIYPTSGSSISFSSRNVHTIDAEGQIFTKLSLYKILKLRFSGMLIITLKSNEAELIINTNDVENTKPFFVCSCGTINMLNFYDHGKIKCIKCSKQYFLELNKQ